MDDTNNLMRALNLKEESQKSRREKNKGDNFVNRYFILATQRLSYASAHRYRTSVGEFSFHSLLFAVYSTSLNGLRV